MAGPNPALTAEKGCGQRSSLPCPDPAPIGGNGVLIGLGHCRVEPEPHRSLELRAVLAEPLREGPLDLIVAPGADAPVLVRRNVTRDNDAPGSFELATTLAQVCVVGVFVHLGRVA